MKPSTLFTLSGITVQPAKLSSAVLILIDYQNVYLSGALELAGATVAVQKAEALLATARKAGTRIIHIAHAGAKGGGFDRTSHSGAFIAGLSPHKGESVVEKIRPNGFSDTNLAELVGPAGTEIMIAGFMTHNCVSSTARAAKDFGYGITIAADACATRDLPFQGGVIAASDLHNAVLAGLSDHHACICDVSDLIDG